MAIGIFPSHQARAHQTNLYPYRADIARAQRRIAWRWVLLYQLVPAIVGVFYAIVVWGIYPSQQKATHARTQQTLAQVNTEYQQAISSLDTAERTIIQRALRSNSYHPVLRLIVTLGDTMPHSGSISELNYDDDTKVVLLTGHVPQSQFDALFATLQAQPFIAHLVMMRRILTNNAETQFTLALTMHAWQADEALLTHYE